MREVEKRPFDRLSPDSGVHALLDFRQPESVCDEAFKFAGFVRIESARELLGFPFEAVSVALNES